MRLHLAASLGILLFASACNAQETDPSFCADVNAQWKQCRTMRVDCTKTLENSRPDLVDKIRQCPVSATMDMMPPSGKNPDIGLIPCCVSADKQNAE